MNDGKEHNNEDKEGPIPPGSPERTPVKEPDVEGPKVKDPALPDQEQTRLK